MLSTSTWRLRQECEQCQNVKLEREVETLSVALEPGMRDGQVCGMTQTKKSTPVKSPPYMFQPRPNPQPHTDPSGLHLQPTDDHLMHVFKKHHPSRRSL